MAVSEMERTELANRLVEAIGKESTETLMKCIIPEGRSQLATKEDVRVLGVELRAEMAELRGEFAELRGDFAGLQGEFAELRGEFAGLRGEFAELRGHTDSALARQTRLIMTTMVGFMLTIWVTLLVPAIL